jgi:hypothetical protein
MQRKAGNKTSMDFDSSVSSNSAFIMDGGTGSEGGARGLNKMRINQNAN